MPRSPPFGYANARISLGRSQSSVSGSQDDAVRDRVDCVQRRVYLGRLFSTGGAGGVGARMSAAAPVATPSSLAW